MVARTLTAADFADTDLGRAVEACVTLHQSGRPIGDPTVALRDLRRMGVDSRIADSAYIARAVNSLPSIASLPYHCERVRDLARLRRLVAVAARVPERVTAPDAHSEDVIGWLEAELLACRHGAEAEARPIADVWESVVSDLQGQVGKPERPVLLSGLPAADRLGMVFAPAELTVLAARPSVGKTALATQIAMHHANKGRPVFMASLEMKDREVGSRILFSSAGHNHQIVRTAQRIDQDFVNDIRAAKEGLGRPPFFLWSPGRVKAGRIHAMASYLKASHDIRLVIIDYLQLVIPEGRRSSRNDEVGETMKALNDIAERLDVPVLLLCQLNREGAKERPQMHHLRDSGEIEQDADVVAFLHPESEQSVSLIVAKNRQGSKGCVPLRWHREQTRFEDESTGREWQPFAD